MQALLKFLLLPSEVSDFEKSYLRRMNSIALWFFASHLPIISLVAWANGTGIFSALFLTAAVVAGPICAINTLRSERLISVTMGVTAMFMGGVLVHFGQGPVQIEMHFYFFVLLALLAVFANPMVILVAAVTVALHHALLWFLLPESVFNYDAPLWVVAVHALFVVLESVAACFIARSFFDNVVELEKIVTQRTAELAARNRDIKTLLDSVDQGFFTIDRNGVMSEERSAAVDKWLGAPKQGGTIFDYLQPYDSKFATWLGIGLEEVFAEIMPIELTLSQLPSRLVANSRTLQFEFHPVRTSDKLNALAVVISDISARVEQERMEAEYREMTTMVERISRDRVGFLEFIQEAEEIVQNLRQETRTDVAIVKRRVHTLKGNSAIFGLERIAAICHKIEDYISEHGELPEDKAWTELFGRWAGIRGYLRRLIGEKDSQLDIGDNEYRAVLKMILNHGSRDAIAKKMASWCLEPTSKRLSRVAEQARNLAKRLGKGEVQVIQNHHDLKLDPIYWANFWSAFVHVVRNALDHGIEPIEERITLGKSEMGTLTVTTKVQEDSFEISLRDDGRGIDWDRLAEIGKERGIPVANREDLVQVLFADGVTTAESVTETSGRGIGMSAIKAACEDLGGTIFVESEFGVGTTIRFEFPIRAMAPNTVDLLHQHGIAEAERITLLA